MKSRCVDFLTLGRLGEFLFVFRRKTDPMQSQVCAKRKRANVMNSTSDDDDYESRKEYELISDSIVEDNDQEELVLQSRPVQKPTHPPHLSQAAPPAQTQLLIDKYPPLVTSDLAVHKKKIEELDRWMKTLSDSTPKVLLRFR